MPLPIIGLYGNIPRIGREAVLAVHRGESLSICARAEHVQYAGRFNWNDCLASTGVMRYAKEAMLGMIGFMRTCLFLMSE